MTQGEREARAMLYRAALEDGVLKEALTEIEARFTEEWKTTYSADERDNLWRSIRIIHLLRSHMASIVGGESTGISAIRRIK